LKRLPPDLARLNHKAACTAFAAAAVLLSACTTVKTKNLASAEDKTTLICRDLLQAGEKAFHGGNIELAQKCFNGALTEAEKQGKESANVALALDDMALIAAFDPDTKQQDKTKLPQAIAYQKRALAIEEKLYGKDNAYLAYDLNNLGAWLGASGDYKAGAEALQRAASIREKTLGPDDGQYAFTLANLADNYVHQQRYNEAIDLFKKSIDIYQRAQKPGEGSRILSDLAELYDKLNQPADGDTCLERALVLREKAFGKDDIMVAETLNNLAVSLYQQGKYEEAEPLFERALKIVQKDGDKKAEAGVVSGIRLCKQKLSQGSVPTK